MEHKEHIVGHDELILQESDLDMEIIVSRVFCATPPKELPLGEGRM